MEQLLPHLCPKARNAQQNLQFTLLKRPGDIPCLVWAHVQVPMCMRSCASAHVLCAHVQVLMCKCSVQVLMRKCSCACAHVQVLMCKCTCASARVQVLMCKCVCSCSCAHNIIANHPDTAMSATLQLIPGQSVANSFYKVKGWEKDWHPKSQLESLW